LIVIEEGKDKRKGCGKGSSRRERSGNVEWKERKGKEGIKWKKRIERKVSLYQFQGVFAAY